MKAEKAGMRLGSSAHACTPFPERISQWRPHILAAKRGVAKVRRFVILSIPSDFEPMTLLASQSQLERGSVLRLKSAWLGG